MSNTKLICILKLLTEMKDFGINYNLTKIYSSFKIFKSENIISKNNNLLSK